MRHESIFSVGAWARETFPGGDDMGPRHALRMLEEALELCEAVGVEYREMAEALANTPARGAELAKVPEEMADVVICLCSMAARRNVDLWAEVERKMEINRARKWRLNADGTGYHVKLAEEAK